MRVKSKKLISLMLLVLLMMTVLVGCGGSDSTSGGEQPAKRQFFTFAANPSSSAFYPYWVAVGKAVQDTYPQFQVTVSESQGAVDIVNRIRSGESILGNAVSSTDFENYNGTGTFDGNPDKTARILWYYAEAPMYICVSKEGGITDISQLSGKKFNMGGTGTSGAVLANDIFKLFNITVDSFESSQSDAADAYASRQIEGTIKFGSTAGDSYIMQLNAALPIDVLSLTEEQIESIIEKYPYLSKSVIPAGTYDGIDHDINTVAFYQGATSTTRLSQEDGYNIIKAVYEDGKATIDAGFPSGADVDILEMALLSSIPLHAGTVQYMVENGIDVPEALIPEEYQAK